MTPAAIVDPAAATYGEGYRLVPHFRQRPDGPPKDWAPTHNHALKVTVLHTKRPKAPNRPVPRLANHHYRATMDRRRESGTVLFP